MDYLTTFLIIVAALHQAQGRPELPIYQHYGSHGLYQNHLPVAVVHELPYHGPTALPVVLKSGHLADTPEVATAKAHHLIAVAHAKADKYYNGQGEHNYGGAYGYSGSHHGYAVPVVLPSGHLADTHEVAAAKSTHLQAVAQAKAEQYYSGHGEGYGYSGSYHGYGVPLVLPNGYLADTHEVTAAKSAHLQAVAQAKAEQYYPGHGEGYGHSSSYHGYGVPLVLPNGHLADTHEVAAAKSAHMTAVAHAKAQQDVADYPDLEDHHGHYVPDYHTEHLQPIVVHQHETYYSHPVLLHSGNYGDAHELSAVQDHTLNYLAQDDHTSVLFSH